MKVNQYAYVWKFADRFSRIIVPIIAIFLTWYTIQDVHEHDRLSVMPKISFIIEAEPAIEPEKIRISFQNSGIGPAIVRDFNVEHQEKLVKGIYFNESIPYQPYSRSFVIKKESDKFPVIVTSKDEWLKKGSEVLALLTEEVIAHIEYCSVYGDCWSECSKPPAFNCGKKDSPVMKILEKK